MPNSNSAAVRSFSACFREVVGLEGTNSSVPSVKQKKVSRPMGRMPSTELLEQRCMMSVSYDSGGFTVVTPPAGAKVIHVSSTTGNDAANGSASSPVRSISRAKKMLRSGTGDQMLLKRGDVWKESLGSWSLSGKSSSDPLVIGAYGTGPRPRLDTGNATAFNQMKSNVHDVAIIGVHLSAAGRGNAVPDGVSISGPFSGLLIEDTKIEGYRNNITAQNFFGYINNIKVRRSVVTDSWSRSSHSQGIFADGVKGVTLEENVFDHNGWRSAGEMTMFNHNAYITAKSGGLVARGNVFSNAASHGLQARPGGIVENNSFINNAVGLSFGLVNGGGSLVAGGVTGRVANNIFLGGHGIGSLANGVGLEIANISKAGAQVTGNVFAHGSYGDNAAINLAVGNAQENSGQGAGINNLTISNNVVYDWQRGISISGSIQTGGSGNKGMKGLLVQNNDFQKIRSYQAVNHFAAFNGSAERWTGNRYDVPGNSKTPMTIGVRGLTVSGWSSYDVGARMVKVSYPSPERSISSYDGGFFSGARAMSKSNFSAKYLGAAVVNYIKAGFGGGTVTLPTVPVIRPATSIVVSPSAGPTVTISDASASEADYGTKAMAYTLKLSKASSSTVQVKWETKGISATVTKDYVGTNATYTFKPGETSKTIYIKTIGDRLREGNEQVAVNLLWASNAVIGDSQGKGTIWNDD